MSDRDIENHERCKRIVDELESVYYGEWVRCPHCNEGVNAEDLTHDEETDELICPHCEEGLDTDDPEDLEPYTLYEYLCDVEWYDVEYRIGGDGKYRSVQLMIACGGPNIYIDTQSKQVELYWWGERANYPLDYDICDEIDSIFEEMYLCNRE